MLPVFEELDSLLFYPVQYEGEESSRNVIYTGAAPNQQAIQAVDYLMNKVRVKRWVLEGTDYVYPRTTNKILAAYLKQKGVADEDIMVNYTPFSFSDWQTEVSKIKAFGGAGKKTAVVSTVNGDANVPFYKELANQGIKATDIPVVAFSVGEEELSGLDTKPLVGHLAAWNYFESIDTPENKAFIAAWHKFTGNDKLEAGGGSDTIDGGPGLDSVLADGYYASEDGNDVITVRDGESDSVSCGLGADRVTADIVDVIDGPDCEYVDRPAATTPAPAPGPAPAPAPGPVATPMVAVVKSPARATLGGLLSKGHPLGATGLAQCTELVQQLRGTADKRQVPEARLALQHNLGLGGACVVTLYERIGA